MRRLAIILTEAVFLIAPLFLLLPAGCFEDRGGHGPDMDHHPDDHGQVGDDHHGDASPGAPHDHDQDHR